MLSRIVVIAAISLSVASCSEDNASAIPPPASLLQCPASQTSSSNALVTALGGTVSVGGTSIQIPAGALLTATTISVTVPASQFMEIDVKANNLTSFLFQQSVSITIDYSRCSAAESSKTPLTVWHIDAQTKELLENMGGVDNKTSHTITFSTGHLSGYAVAF